LRFNVELLRVKCHSCSINYENYWYVLGKAM
jgi:hypothetical protein